MDKLSMIKKGINWEHVSWKRMKYFKSKFNSIKTRCPRYRSLNFSVQTFWRLSWVWHVFRRSTGFCRCPKMSPYPFRYSRITTCPNLITSCPILINIWAAFFGFSTQIPFGLRCSFRVFSLASPFLLFHFFIFFCLTQSALCRFSHWSFLIL